MALVTLHHELRMKGNSGVRRGALPTPKYEGLMGTVVVSQIGNKMNGGRNRTKDCGVPVGSQLAI